MGINYLLLKHWNYLAIIIIVLYKRMFVKYKPNTCTSNVLRVQLFFNNNRKLPLLSLFLAIYDLPYQVTVIFDVSRIEKSSGHLILDRLNLILPGKWSKWVQIEPLVLCYLYGLTRGI